MAKINLRAYHRIIQDCLKEEKYAEAIFHSTRILQAFPKNILTYRLLAEAYLEQGQFRQASDLFQRILKVIPDDFVANIGMSLFRENEKRMDEAIWHMERAFEVQPANISIQQELKRLYGQRDGVEPARIPLTRPALARLYLRGGLFPQALAELHAIQEEYPSRMDIRVCLASFLLQMGRYAEAIEAADSILDKLTYCLEAIRVMAAATEKLGKPEQGFIYLQRWCELDPYAQFIESMQQDVADIPDQRVLLDWPNEYPEPPHGLEKPPEPGPAKQAAPRERPGEETLADSLNWLYEEEPPSLAVNQPIEKARLAFQKGELEESLFIYQGMVLAGHSLEEVVSDLSQAVESRPSAGAWQVLGDALMRLGREDEAMQAYTNAVNLAKP